MVIPFPERISLLHASLFAFLLTLGLIMSGTGVLFSSLVFVFVVTAAIAFNIAGGLSRPSGAYVFFFATQAVILGLCVKVALWEPTELFLLSPLTTMSMYTGGIIAMTGAVYLTRRFARKEGFLQDVCSTKDMRLAAIGCVVGGVIIPLIADLIIAANVSPVLVPIANASHQIDRFLPMAVILGVTYEIKSSGGKRSLNIWAWAAGLMMMFNGFFLGFSKEGLFTAPVCWLLASAALGYRFRVWQVIALAVFGFVAVYYFVPFCEYGRIFRDDAHTQAERIKISMAVMSDLNGAREKTRLTLDSIDRQTSIFAFFSTSQGLLDRLEMIGIDDKLVTVTDEKGAYGLSPIGFYFASLVPKFIWKDKPFVIMGNRFAHELGYAEDDNTTGISFSPVVEGYHEAKWFGVFVVCPMMWLACFVLVDSLCGDVRKSPWGLLATATFAHVAPEGMLQGIFYFSTYGAFAVCVVAFLSAYVMPLLAHFVSPPRREFGPPQPGSPGSKSAFLNGRPAPAER